MKVCHFIASKGLGRGEAYIDLVNALCSRIEIVLLVPKGALFLSRIDKRVQVIEYRSKDRRRNPFLHFEIHAHIRKAQPDVVHTHFAKATEIFCTVNRFLGLPHVATKHNPRKGRIFDRVDNVIAVSEGVRQSVSGGKATTIYNGIQPVVIDPVEKGPFFKICAVGRLDKIKGFDLLIREVARLDFDFVLEIAGDGNEMNALSRLITELDLGEKVKLLGFRTDIPQILASADLQVMSSLSEGFSLAMVEAIFYAKVFISTDVAGCREVLATDLIIKNQEIAAKITAVAENYPAYVETFSQVKNQYQEQLNIDQVAERYLEYYAEMLK